MTNNLELKQSFDVLDRTLETFGADMARWPVPTRQRLSAFVASNGDAQRRIAAAAALDRVLDAAPRLSDARQAALLDSITQRAERQPRLASDRAQPPQNQFSRLRRHSMAAAALAASLMIGVLSGQNSTLGSVTAAIVNGGDFNTTSGQQMALSEDTNTLLDEDLL